MKSVAFIFSHSPYGCNIGREGVDSVLSASLVFKKIGLFFVNEGIFQLIPNQQPQKILLHNYLLLLELLPIYGIKTIYCCKKSFKDRGMSNINNLSFNVKYLNPKDLKKYINNYNFIINF
ncbi:Protein TusC [Buchnera aphidicola (Eriosoma grossulariae)]|uniref:sulfurtransferase complex subunit TusC n=1 Tax=Buchnera aphidicola TaxID=9 RepID=UPI003464C334